MDKKLAILKAKINIRFNNMQQNNTNNIKEDEE